ncbi:cytochrome P450 [Ganoderma sinense ZZ0214-1]|uniref:Cytochrome P450 n=1 Tax=Ganoderma sinense ZZ0214-1 TaxID=1077348 RepID=A0A2G8SJG9_9APHY|nr:cytochrome P450 [Ganoderma sinense ZZ0214-1]
MSAALVLVAGIVLVALIKFWRTLYRSPLRHLRGPRAPSVLSGHFNQLAATHQALIREWVNEYGPNFKIRGFFNAPSLFTTDTKAIHHVLTHSTDYCKPLDARRLLARLSGPAGVLVTEGEQHRNQRRVMNPAFGPVQIRGLMGVFHEKSLALRDYWMSQVSEDGSIRTNVGDGISKMTLDVIGVAGFNYDFETLRTDKPTNEVNKAFQALFQSPLPRGTFALLARFFPILMTLFPTERTKAAAQALAVMRRFGMQLIEEKKQQIMSEKTSHSVEKKDVQGRDILSLLIKSNLASDVPENQRLTDEDVLAQVPTFLAAGHETTATATGWLLCELSKHPEFQQKLREELLSVDTDTPTMEALNELPYLDKVVRETLRLHAPVLMVNREAQRDDVIPVSEPFVDAQCTLQREIAVKRGDMVFIGIAALQTAEGVWGEDALEFKPDRWDDPPEAITNTPGVWGHLLTFLGGTRACIGYRFSLVELKALIFALIRAFEFELTAPAEDIQAIGRFLQRAGLRGQEVPALPLLIRPYRRV